MTTQFTAFQMAGSYWSDSFTGRPVVIATGSKEDVVRALQALADKAKSEGDTLTVCDGPGEAHNFIKDGKTGQIKLTLAFMPSDLFESELLAKGYKQA
jgi:hypothetical protein